MRFNYTLSLALLCAIKGIILQAGSSSDAHKGIGVGIVVFIFLMPIALFFDWRVHVKERRD